MQVTATVKPGGDPAVVEKALAEEMAPAVHDVLLNPTFPDQELARLEAQSLATIQQDKSEPRNIAYRLFPSLVYGEGHAYANPFSGIGTEESVRSMTTEELRGFYQRWVRPDNATLLIVGDTTLAQIEPLLEHRWPLGRRQRSRCQSSSLRRFLCRRSRGCSASTASSVHGKAAAQVRFILRRWPMQCATLMR
jgi:hypothetical protein